MRLSYTYTIILATVFFILPLPAMGATALQVPFIAQAPLGDWRQPWQDACEEAVITMVDGFYHKYPLDPIRGKNEILKAFDIKETYFGKSLDEDANQIVSQINNFYSWEAYVVAEPQIAQIKHEIDQGRPVILPTYGVALQNPYFRDAGPNYHTIVISGYDDATQEFITQEPGTSNGEDFRYSYTRLMTAMHDFVVGRKTETGRKVAIFTRRNAKDSLALDGDKDGLTKEQEFRLGTNPAAVDTDGDGYSDYVEVEHGYSPLTNESLLGPGSLVKMATDPRVFLIENGIKRHILTEEVFLRHNWNWSNVQEVGKTFLQSLETGPPVS